MVMVSLMLTLIIYTSSMIFNQSIYNIVHQMHVHFKVGEKQEVGNYSWRLRVNTLRSFAYA